MGMIGSILGSPQAVSAIGDTVKGVAEVFTPSATKRMELSAKAQMAALDEFGAEFANPSLGAFDRLINGLNRLPRPLLAFGTIGLFIYAMVDPQAFAGRMVGLNAVPEPLWWLLGAVVAFYFGARETFYFRNRPVTATGLPMRGTGPAGLPEEDNLALADWRAGRD